MREGKVPQQAAKILPAIVAEGHTVKEAIKIQDKVQRVSFSAVFNKTSYKRLLKTHGGTKGFNKYIKGLLKRDPSVKRAIVD